MKYLANAFSLQMRGEDVKRGCVKVEMDLTPELVGDLSDYESFIGHQDTANLLAVPMHRGALTLNRGDRLVVAQLTGADGNPYRLPEGTTTIPEGVKFTYIGCFYIGAEDFADFYHMVGSDILRNAYGNKHLEAFLWSYAGSYIHIKESVKEEDNGWEKKTTYFTTNGNRFRFVIEYWPATGCQDAESEYSIDMEIGKDTWRQVMVTGCLYQ